MVDVIIFICYILGFHKGKRCRAYIAMKNTIKDLDEVIKKLE